MVIKNSILRFQSIVQKSNSQLVAVSKTKSNAEIMEAYDTGQRDFGENKVQELARKAEELPKDIRWHMIGHLQRNKVKYIAPFVYLIHSVDSIRLLSEINKQALKNDRTINVLLQVYIASEDTKFGLSNDELISIIEDPQFNQLENVKVIGLMGMASYTKNEEKIRNEFRNLHNLYENLKTKYNHLGNIDLNELSMGMTSDYEIALSEGSTLIRVGSAIFGERNYPNKE